MRSQEAPFFHSFSFLFKSACLHPPRPSLLETPGGAALFTGYRERVRERGREPRNTRTDERRHRLSVRSSGASRFMYRRVAEPDAEQHNVLPHQAPASEAATTAVPHLHNRCRAPRNEAHRANSWRHTAGVSLSDTVTNLEVVVFFVFFCVKVNARPNER